MTDNDIIKALECCVSEQYTCEQCPYQEIKHYDSDNGFEIMPNGKQYDDWSCERWLNTDLLDLINRQKEEIEKLRNANHILAILESEANTKVDELENDVEGMAQDIIMYKGIISGKTNECNKARAEAVKEFADILKGDAVGWLEITVDDIEEAKRKVLNRND